MWLGSLGCRQCLHLFLWRKGTWLIRSWGPGRRNSRRRLRNTGNKIKIIMKVEEGWRSLMADALSQIELDRSGIWWCGNKANKKRRKKNKVSPSSLFVSQRGEWIKLFNFHAWSYGVCSYQLLFHFDFNLKWYVSSLLFSCNHNHNLL